MEDIFTTEHSSACQCPDCCPALTEEQNIILLGGELIGYYQVDHDHLPEPLADTSYSIED